MSLFAVPDDVTKQRLVTKPFHSFSLFYRFIWYTNSHLTSLAGLRLSGYRIEMKEKPLPLNSTVDLWPWEHFNQKYLTQFGGILRIQCSTLVFTIIVDNRGTDNGSICVESG